MNWICTECGYEVEYNEKIQIKVCPCCGNIASRMQLRNAKREVKHAVALKRAIAQKQFLHSIKSRFTSLISQFSDTFEPLFFMSGYVYLLLLPLLAIIVCLCNSIIIAKTEQIPFDTIPYNFSQNMSAFSSINKVPTRASNALGLVAEKADSRIHQSLVNINQSLVENSRYHSAEDNLSKLKISSQKSFSNFSKRFKVLVDDNTEDFLTFSANQSFFRNKYQQMNNAFSINFSFLSNNAKALFGDNTIFGMQKIGG